MKYSVDSFPMSMAAAAASSSTFPLFSSLSPELRNQIWHDALPDEPGPALYFYIRKFRCPQRLSESNDKCYPENDRNNLNYEFQHDLSDDVQYEVPLAFVNREARGIALAWVYEQGLTMCSQDDRHYPVFARHFDPTRDALYLPFVVWDACLCDPDDRQCQPELFEHLVATKSEFRRIAVPRAILRSAFAILPTMFEYLPRLQVLYVILAKRPDLQSADNNKEVQGRWEIDSTQGGAFLWNYDRGDFDFGDGESIGAEDLDRTMGEDNGYFGEELARNHIRNFQVRFVFAGRG